MTQRQYLIKRKLSLIELSQTLGSVSEACRKLNVSRQHFHDVKKARTKARAANRVSDETEAALLDDSPRFPTHGQVRAANELAKKDVTISAGGVRSVCYGTGWRPKSSACPVWKSGPSPTAGF